MPLREIAQQLGVATILEGGVQRAGNRVRVNVQLIEAATDAHLWAETYDEELTAANVFAIQSDLARKIADALHARLSPETRARIATRPTESLEAYDLLTRARYVLTTRGTTRAGIEDAIEMLRRAIDVDPDFAAAHADLAYAYRELLRHGYGTEADLLPRARHHVAQALELDPDLSDAYVTLAAMQRWDGDLAGAEASAQRALALNPGSARAHSAYATTLRNRGRAEDALREARRAVQLDPMSLALRRALLNHFAETRRYDDAIAEARRTLELAPDDAETHYAVASSWILKGEFERGLASYRRAVELNGEDPYYAAGLAWGHARAGRHAEARRWLATAEQLDAPLKERAIVLAELGDLDAAYRLLDRAVATERFLLTGLAFDHTADALRADPRWPALTRRLGAAPDPPTGAPTPDG